jgi:hypothetical protein
MNSHASGASCGGFDTSQKIEELRRKKSSTASDNDGFPAFLARLRNLLLPEKFKPLGITKYDTKQDPVQWLKCYVLSIENAGGNNDTKCLSNWRLRHGLCHVGCWAGALSAGSPTVSQTPSSPCSTGSEGGISCKQRNFVVSIENIEK